MNNTRHTKGRGFAGRVVVFFFIIQKSKVVGENKMGFIKQIRRVYFICSLAKESYDNHETMHHFYTR